MRAARVDANQPEIVEALRKAGASVECLHAVGKGVPDLLVGYRGSTVLMEVKDGSKPPSERKLRQNQQEWHTRWKGAKPFVVESIEQALEALRSV